MRLWTQSAEKGGRKLAQNCDLASSYRGGPERYWKQWTGWCATQSGPNQSRTAIWES